METLATQPRAEAADPRRGPEAEGTSTGRFARELRFAATELALWGALYAAYMYMRTLALESAGDAVVHAEQLIDLERVAGLLHEAGIQRAILSVESLSTFFDLYYMLGFGPLLGLFLSYLSMRRRHAYRELRTALVSSLALATVFYVFYPAAPPRLVGELGIADTVGLHGTGSFAGIRFNPYAAMPSMHVGWSLLVAVVAVRVFRRRALRVLFVAHPFLMTVAVTATGNHFVIDALVGAAVALVGYAIVSCRALRLVARIRSVSTLAERACAARGWPGRRAPLAVSARPRATASGAGVRPIGFADWPPGRLMDIRAPTSDGPASRGDSDRRRSQPAPRRDPVWRRLTTDRRRRRRHPGGNQES